MKNISLKGNINFDKKKDIMIMNYSL